MTYHMDIKKIIRNYYEQPYVHTFDSLVKMDQFLERQKLPTLTQGKMDNLNRPISIK